jgi:putative autotransporter adhesin-like protein
VHTPKHIRALVAVSGAMTLLAFAQPAAAFELFGSGVSKSENRTPGNFTRIEASGSTILEITAGQSSTVVTVTGDDNIVPLVNTTVSGDVLHISTEGIHRTNLPLVVKIGLPTLSGIHASGASKISAINLKGDHFDLDGSGSTKATIGGAVGRLGIKVSGAGHVDAGGLAVKDADVSTSGAGNVEVNASDKLAVRISGAGKVMYHGHPAVTEHISGAGKVAHLD